MISTTLQKQELTVVRIDVNGFNESQFIASYEIKVKDFKTSPNYYDGNYKEVFYNEQGLLITYLDADLLTVGVPSNYSELVNSKVDFAVYWPGTVSVWLDYVRVDDEWVHFLFTDSLGIAPGNEFLKFHQRIHEEVDYLSNANGFTYFYLDEYAYNNIPCIAEVNRLVKKYNPKTPAE